VTGARSTDSDNDGLSDEEYDPKAASEGSLSSRKRSGNWSLFVKLDTFVFSVSSDVSNSDSLAFVMQVVRIKRMFLAGLSIPVAVMID